jgi:hypothetical protein
METDERCNVLHRSKSKQKSSHRKLRSSLNFVFLHEQLDPFEVCPAGLENPALSFDLTLAPADAKPRALVVNLVPAVYRGPSGPQMSINWGASSARFHGIQHELRQESSKDLE